MEKGKYNILNFKLYYIIQGIQLISIGILSEYISKMYLEIKQRPKYIIKEKIDR